MGWPSTASEVPGRDQDSRSASWKTVEFSIFNFRFPMEAGAPPVRKTENRRPESENYDDACFSYVASNSSTNLENSLARSGSPAAV